jgi:hypothetical protein
MFKKRRGRPTDESATARPDSESRRLRGHAGNRDRVAQRAPYGTLGMFLSDHDAQGPKEAFLLGTEFAHLHPLPDGSLHMVLPPEVHHAAIQRGWGVPHPMAGLPTVSPQTILIFAPRDATERAVVVSLIRSAEAYARGHDYGVRGIARV